MARQSFRRVADLPALVAYRNAAAGLPQLDTTVPAGGVHALAVSAARLLFRSTDECSFAIYEMDGRTYFEAITADATARIGPVDGLRRPRSLSPHSGIRLPDLIAHLGAAPDPNDYVVEVKYRDYGRRPRRRKDLTEEAYQTELAEFEEQQRQDQAKSGLKTIRYTVPPCDWTADDVSALVGMIFAILPEHRRLWRVEIQHENHTKHPHPKNTGWRLVISGDTFEAALRLPSCPGEALADWIERRGFSLRLEIPEAEIRRAARCSAS